MDTTAKIIYRKARPADCSIITRFQIAMALETEGLRLDPETCARGVRAALKDSAKGRYFIAQAQGEVVGSLMLTSEWSDWRNGMVWWIQSVYISPEHRALGVFKGLYRYVQRAARKSPKVRGLRLYVERHNRTARAVYSRLGMAANRYDVYEWMKGI